MNNKIKAAQKLYRGFINTYNLDEENITWIDGHVTTQAEWDAIAEETARLNRAEEYPPIGDQLDAMWKGGEDAAEMLAKVQAVKEKYPKPE
jgi:hypothetical protein